MLIDPNAILRGQVSSQASLPPELERLVTDLKLSLGEKADALVARVSQVSSTERQQLLALHSTASEAPAQRLMRALIQDPQLKLVEVKIQQHLLPTLTNLPVRKGEALQVLLTARGLVLLPSASGSAPPSSFSVKTGGLPNPVAAAPPAGTTGGVLAPLSNSAPGANGRAAVVPATGVPATGVPATGMPATGVTVAGALPQGTATQKEPPSAALVGKSVPSQAAAAMKSLATPPPPLPTGPPATAPSAVDARAAAAPSSLGTRITAQGADENAGGAVTNPRPKTVASQPLLANALARALPIAGGLRPLLQATAELNRQLVLLPPALRPPLLQQLQTLLNKVPGLALDLARLDPAQPGPLVRAMTQSGIFYEQRLIQLAGTQTSVPPSSLPEQDLKGALVYLQQWLGSAPTAPAAARGGIPDTLGQLFLGLAQLFNPRQRAQSERPALPQLRAAVQQAVERGLAQIQVQQYRTLNAQLLDPAAPQQWHMDVPLRMPDGFGNLYLQISEPRVAAEPEREHPKKSTRSQRKGRWKVFMELTLDEMGELAAEIAVTDQQLEVTLWAEQTDLRQRANAHLQELKQDLEKQGLIVNELRCSQNPPPAQKMHLDYALIDVKT